jgi:hypothetical protein
MTIRLRIRFEMMKAFSMLLTIQANPIEETVFFDLLCQVSKEKGKIIRHQWLQKFKQKENRKKKSI